jgi:hypothetical protein
VTATLMAPFEAKQVMASHIPRGCRMTVYEGAVRSSKTVVADVNWGEFVATAPDGDLAMLGVTQDTIVRNVLLPMQEMFGTDRITINRGTGTATIFGRLVYIFGASDIRSMTKIQGLSLVGAYVDEVANMPEAVFEMLMTRLSEPGAWMIVTCNPEGPKHWFLVNYLARCRWWITREGERRLQLEDVKVKGELLKPMPWMRVTFVLEDNVWLCRNNPDYVADIKASKTGVFYRRMILAEWASADGMVYPGFSPAQQGLTSAQLEHVKIERVLMAGLDYGQNHDTRGYLIGLGSFEVHARTGRPMWEHPDDGLPAETITRHALFVLSEFAPKSATVGQHAALFDAWLTGSPWGPPEWVAIDPAALTIRTELFARGRQNVQRAHNRVLPGIQTVESLLMSGGLWFVVDNCPQLVEKLPGYMWDVKASERGVTAVVKQNDDEADALRYAIFTSRNEWQPYVKLAPIDETAGGVEADADEAA